MKENEFLYFDDYVLLVCKSKKYVVFYSKIDYDDIEKIKKYYWNIRYDKRYPKHYIETFQKGKRIHLHRYILGLYYFSKSKTIDHINGDSLDNRKSNLRICTHKENMQNLKIQRRSKSGIKFISWSNTHDKWLISHKNRYIGMTNNLEIAKKMLEDYLILH